jgi:transcriptional regulator with XRE-family HTH domain
MTTEEKMNIKERRKSKNMTQEELSQALGVKRSTIAMWESGENEPRLSMLVRLSQVLGCTPNDLLGFETKEEERA